MKIKSAILFFALLLFVHLLNAQERIKTESLFPGINYQHIQNDSIPLSIHILEIDLTKENIGVEVGIANDIIGTGGETVSSFVNRNQSDSIIIVGAVNGDFFGGVPHTAQNCMVVDGEFAKGVVLDRTLFGITNNKKPIAENIVFNGMAVFENDTINIDALNDKPDDFSTALLNKFYGNKSAIGDSCLAILIDHSSLQKPNEWHTGKIKNIYQGVDTVYYKPNESVLIINEKTISELTNIDERDSIKYFLGTHPRIANIQSLIGGLPRLISNGKIPETYLGKESLASERFLLRHPRTAVGFTQDSTKLILVLADGRQENLSIGIELKKLAELMLELGCYNAVNLDGGGSSAMVVKNRLVNSPSDKTGERKVHNFLYVTYKLN
ncbi:MAG: phosphodiester glycosidase family protein [Ignavibacteriae bacterium]|nr:phosphodiester glycosidase family protein [Ignavibacteriota bacterium]NOG99615.1 phosphodiester glycosidase family protein [Ignavibacteriota bacterium]